MADNKRELILDILSRDKTKQGTDSAARHCECQSATARQPARPTLAYETPINAS